ncbi:MAG: D-sedoheptulose 7-phosphate isomerase [Candidatus Omnitrophica bacterium]|nr:D-sedoheptulose 7-phosphate isomerase [Candidatus Omnitrophota bacterium]MBU1997040.1 D-sedoheptulose 7-phosphate isomerase [Candidatus Omnitrophota bacterium]
MKEKIRSIFNESIEVKYKTLDQNLDKIVLAIKEINKAVNKNKKILLFGNGGSAADSQHIAAEFIGRFKKERRAVGAIALTTDTSCLTALGNDYSFDIIFSRQIEGLGQKGDIAIGISTSGNSKNVIEGIKKAKDLGLTTITLTGCDGGKLSKISDISIIVPSNDTARIQESHSCIAHAICELVESSI